MDATQQLIAEWAPRATGFALIGTRVAALLATAPPFAGETMPLRVRAALASLLALVLAPMIPAVPTLAAGGLLAAAAGEAMIGLAMGLCVRLVFAAAQAAGSLAGLQMGLGFASVLDPLAGESAVATGRLLGALALGLFITVDGHHLIVAGLHHSLRVAPPATPLDLRGLAGAVVQLGSGLFSSALRMAAPVIAALLLVNLALGLIGRFAPQLGIFQIGFLVATAGGLVLMAVAMPAVGAVIAADVRGLPAGFGRLLGAL